MEKHIVNCQKCGDDFYWELGLEPFCDDCLKEKEEEKTKENGYIIDFTNFIPEEREETLRLLIVDEMSPFPEHLFIFKDKQILLTSWEFKAMVELEKRAEKNKNEEW